MARCRFRWNAVNRIVVLFTSLLLLLVVQDRVQAEPHLVPCGVFQPNYPTCAKAVIDGVVDGQWIALIYKFDGTNGGPTEIAVISVGSGGNGEVTKALRSISPDGQYADQMSATFRDGKLFVSNATYLPGEAHCCYTHLTYRRFGFHDRPLVAEREATVPIKATNQEVDDALEKGAHFF